MLFTAYTFLRMSGGQSFEPYCDAIHARLGSEIAEMLREEFPIGVAALRRFGYAQIADDALLELLHETCAALLAGENPGAQGRDPPRDEPYRLPQPPP